MGYARHTLTEIARAHYQYRNPSAPDVHAGDVDEFSREELEILFAADLIKATRFATWMDSKGKTRPHRNRAE